MTDASKPLLWEKYRDSTLKHETQYTQNQCMYTWNACQEACAAHAAEKDATIARLESELAAAKLKSSFDVLAQIHDFRKTHPMDEGFARTFEFIGTLYYQYQAAIDAAEGGSRP